jgi:hypothetical protein
LVGDQTGAREFVIEEPNLFFTAVRTVSWSPTNGKKYYSSIGISLFFVKPIVTVRGVPPSGLLTNGIPYISNLFFIA